MCGIFGYVGAKEATPILLKGLKRLEYRGYDSAGIVVLNGSARFAVLKKKGKVNALAQAAAGARALSGTTGLGHTRWATHGMPSDRNAHPHLDTENRIAVVHNGIIENFMQLRARLEARGCEFRSETDSEVLAHLIGRLYRRTGNLERAIGLALKEIHGSYAIGVIHRDEPGRLVAARRDSPLVIGIGKNENFVSSDIPALLDHTRRVIPLENGEIAVIDAAAVRITGPAGRPVRRAPRTVSWNIAQAEKGDFSHFMLKEIFEQPRVVAGIIEKRLRNSRVVFEELRVRRADFRRIRNVVIVACGTSFHAGLVGRYLLEELTRYRVSVETSSEFRYRNPKLGSDTLAILISQSGETADTLAALREAKRRSARTIAICNVLGSSLEREADGVIYTGAGPEIAVASTKAYTAQIAVLVLLAFYVRGSVFGKNDRTLKALVAAFRKIPAQMQEFLRDYEKDRENWQRNVRQFNRRYHQLLEDYYVKKSPAERKRAPNSFFLYLGRNINYPSALEGALKLKEISYISAEGYPAGEMKHGPIALIDENPWVVCIAVRARTYDKMISNIQEIKARGGLVTAIVTKGDREIKKQNLFLYIEVPETPELLSPLVVALPLQLIAFSVAREFGEEIDQPRNLAKSVTVE